MGFDFSFAWKKTLTIWQNSSSKMTRCPLKLRWILRDWCKVGLFHTRSRMLFVPLNTFIIIYLTGKYNRDLKTSVEWTSDVDQSHHQGGLELRNNEIVIPRDGLYFVYSQVLFRVNCSSRGDDDAASEPLVHLSHTVKRWSSLYGTEDNRSYQTILHSVRTTCQKTADADGNWFSAVYMGAVFNLKRGDRLQTVMEKKMLEKVEEESGDTFFGVFALWRQRTGRKDMNVFKEASSFTGLCCCFTGPHC